MFISTYSQGGLIQSVLHQTTLGEAKKWVGETAFIQRFDEDKDDARVFQLLAGDQELVEVYSYDDEDFIITSHIEDGCTVIDEIQVK